MQSTYEKTGKLQRKIDVYLRYHHNTVPAPRTIYLHSTNWHRTCREAIEAAIAQHPPLVSQGKLFARFAPKN